MPKKKIKQNKKVSPRKKADQKKSNHKKVVGHKRVMPRKKITDQKKIRTLSLSVIILSMYSVIVSLAFAILLWYTIAYHLPIQKNVAVSTSSFSQSTAVSAVTQSIGVPVRIIIPSINVDSTIEKVGLKSDGSMDVPKDPMNTGWYDLGPRPGEIGSAVIDGHVDWWYGAPAVFPDLYKLKVGDKIIVEDEFGLYISFIVRGTESYDATANATNVFTSNDGKAHLNLITCAGAWDYSSNQYANRLVVFADKE